MNLDLGNLYGVEPEDDTPDGLSGVSFDSLYDDVAQPEAVVEPPKSDIEQNESFIGDLPTLAGGAIGNLSKGIYGAAEWASELLPEGNDVTPWAKANSRAIASFLEDRMATYTPETQAALEKKWVESGAEAAWKDPRAWFGQAVNSAAYILPSVLAGVVTGGSATAAQITALVAEGVLVAGDAAVGIREEIEKIPHEQLLKDAPRYAELVAESGDETKARDKFVEETRKLVVPAIAATSSVMGRLGGKVGDKLAGKIPGANRAGAFVRGATREASQESVQSGAEQVGRNIAGQEYDPDRTLTEGVAESVAAGTALGGVTGGTITGVVGDSQTDSAPATEPSPVAEEGFDLDLTLDDDADLAVFADSAREQDKDIKKEPATPEAAPVNSVRGSIEGSSEETPVPTVAQASVSEQDRSVRAAPTEQIDLGLEGGTAAPPNPIDVGPPAPAAEQEAVQLVLPKVDPEAMIAAEKAETELVENRFGVGVETLIGSVNDERAPGSPYASMRPTDRNLRKFAGALQSKLTKGRVKDKARTALKAEAATKDVLNGLDSGNDSMVMSGIQGLLSLVPKAVRGNEVARRMKDVLGDTRIDNHEKFSRLQTLIDEELGRQANYVGARTNKAVRSDPKAQAARRKAEKLARAYDEATDPADVAQLAVDWVEANAEYQNLAKQLMSSRATQQKRTVKERTGDVREAFSLLAPAMAANPESTLTQYMQSPAFKTLRQGDVETPLPGYVVDDFFKNITNYAQNLDSTEAPAPPKRRRKNPDPEPRKESRKVAKKISQKTYEPKPKTPTRQESAEAREAREAKRQADAIETVEKFQASPDIKKVLDKYLRANTDEGLRAVVASAEFDTAVERAGIDRNTAVDLMVQRREVEGRDFEHEEGLGYAATTLDQAVDYQSVASELEAGGFQYTRGSRLYDDSKAVDLDDAAEAAALKSEYESDAELSKWLADNPGALDLPRAEGGFIPGLREVSAKLARNYYEASRNGGSTDAAALLMRMMPVMSSGTYEGQTARALLENTDPELLRKTKVVFKPLGKDTPLGRYYPDTNMVELYVSEQTPAFIHAALHEITHAVTDRALRNQRFSAAVDLLRKSVPGKYNFYGLTNNHEFLAEAMSNQKFQNELRKVRLPVADQLRVRTALGGKAAPRSKLGNLWDAFKAMVSRWVTNRVPPSDSVLTFALEATNVAAMRAGSEPVLAPADTALELPQIVERVTASRTADLAPKALLLAMSGDQLVESYGREFPEVARWEAAVRHRASAARAEQELSAQLHEEWLGMAFRAKETGIKFNNLLLDATRHAFDPSVGLGHRRNRHVMRTVRNAAGNVTGAQVSPQYTAAVAKLRKQYAALPKEWKTLYNRVRDEYEVRFQRVREQLTINYLDSANLNLTKAQQSTLLSDMLNLDNARGSFDYASYGIPAPVLPPNPTRKQKAKFDADTQVHDAVIEGLDFLRKTVHTKGPYFPLDRNGEWLVEAEKKRVRKFRTKAAREAARDAILADDPSAKITNIKGTLDLDITYRAVSFFESRYEARQFIKDIRKGGEWAGWETQDLPKRKQDLTIVQGPGSFAIQETLTKKFAGDQAAVNRINSALIEFMPEAGALRNAIRRRNVRGASSDMIRAFGKNSMSSAWAYSQLQYGKEIAQSKQDFEDKMRFGSGSGYNTERGGLVLESIHSRDTADAATFGSLSQIESTLVKAGFLWYLFSASYSIINTFQTAMYSAPWLSMKYGTRRTTKELTKAAWAVGRPAVGQLVSSGFGARAVVVGGEYTAENVYERVRESIRNSTAPDKAAVDQMMGWLEKTGQIDSSLIMSMSEGANAPSSDKVTVIGSHVMKAIRYAPQVAEVFNRASTGIAAYRMAKEDGKTEQESREAALVAVRRTHFDYSLTNRPPVLSGKLGKFTNIPGMRAVMLFKTHAVGSMSLMLSMARDSIIKDGKTAESRAAAAKGLALFMSMHMLMAGAIGATPEMLRAMWGLLEMFLSWFEDDDEEIKQTQNTRINQAMYTIGQWAAPEDPEQAKAIGTLLSRGVPAYMGVDVSGRLGLEQMIMPRTHSTGVTRDALHETAFGLLGPLGGILSNAVRMIELHNKGQTLKGIEGFAPKFMKDIMKAERFATDGMTDYAGRVIKPADEFTGADYVIRLAGFAPTKETRLYDTRTATLGLGKRIEDRRSSLLELYHNAGSRREQKEMRERIRAFNKAYPPYRITGGTLVKGRRDRVRRERQTENGAFIERKYRRLLNKEGEFGR